MIIYWSSERDHCICHSSLLSLAAPHNHHNIRRGNQNHKFTFPRQFNATNPKAIYIKIDWPVTALLRASRISRLRAFFHSTGPKFKSSYIRGGHVCVRKQVAGAYFFHLAWGSPLCPDWVTSIWQLFLMTSIFKLAYTFVPIWKLWAIHPFRPIKYMS